MELASLPITADADRPETTAGAAIVAHVANVFQKERQDEAVAWLQQELAAGNLKTRSGAQPTVSEDAGNGLVTLVGEAQKAASGLCEKSNQPELQICDENTRRTIVQWVEQNGHRFRIAILLPIITEAQQLKEALDSLQRDKIMCVMIYLAIWIIVSLQMIIGFQAKAWVFVVVGVLIAIFLYLQFSLTGTLQVETSLFERLRIILISISGVFLSLVVFSNKSPVLNKSFVIEVTLIGLILAFATFAINPRMTEIKVLRWVNNAMRIIIAVTVSCVSAAVIVTLMDYLHDWNLPGRQGSQFD